jgi:glutaconate CoA-transferase subunit B
MDFHPASKRMRLKALHPGVSLDEVIENTGFDLILPDTIGENPPPSDEELRLLREEIDPEGLYI